MLDVVWLDTELCRQQADKQALPSSLPPSSLLSSLTYREDGRQGHLRHGGALGVVHRDLGSCGSHCAVYVCEDRKRECGQWHEERKKRK